MKRLTFTSDNSEIKGIMPVAPDFSDLMPEAEVAPKPRIAYTPDYTPPKFDDADDLTPLKLVDILNERLGVEEPGTNPIFFDTEGLGFHGPSLLIQFAIGDGPIHLWETFRQPIGDTISLLEMFANHEDGIVGFHLAFDWFHLQQLYATLLRLLERLKEKGVENPEQLSVVRCMFELEATEMYNDLLEEYVKAEAESFDHPCLKPVKAMDLMSYARKGPYQNTMERKSLYIRNMPKLVSEDFCNYLNTITDLPEILFARKKVKSPPWRIKEAYLEDGTVDPEFVQLELMFAPSGSLKDIAKDLGIVKDATYFDEISPVDRWPVKEEGWAPYALAPYIEKGQLIQPSPKDWCGRWPTVARLHAEFWATDPKGRKYARDDVHMTREMFYRFKRPKLGDPDSTLACMIGSTRWRGFALNQGELVKAYKSACKKRDELATGLNLNSAGIIKTLFTKTCRCCMKIKCDCSATDSNSSPNPKCPKCRGFGFHLGQELHNPCRPEHTDPNHPGYHKFTPVLTTVEQMLCRNRKNKISFGKQILAKLEKWTEGETECDCFDEEQMCFSPSCQKCGGGGIIRSLELHPAAILTRRIKDYRFENYRAELIQKLMLAGRLHIDLSVTGTLTNRMAGTGGLNAQGIPREAAMRICFKYAFPGYAFCGGDFDGFEVAIAEAVYHDKRLYEALTTGKKVHAIAGSRFYAPMTYDDVLATKDTREDYYSLSKQGFFALLYGGTAQTLVERCRISLDKALAGFQYFMEYFEDWGKARQKIQYDFSTLVQSNIRQPIMKKKPRNSVSSLLGHTRYFTIENTILDMLYQLSQKMPTRFLTQDRIVMKRGKPVTISSAIRSSLTAACFSIQNSIVRAAANHEVQSTGAELTKLAQCELWTLQPPGAHKWIISIFNFHDELNTAVLDERKHETEVIIKDFIEKYKPLVRCLAMKWKLDMRDWSEK